MARENNLKTSIYNAILEDIFNHEYRADQVLNEKTLVEKYGCSKSPVREALVALCNENVLRSIPRYGYEIVRLTTEDIREMLQFRYFIESGAIKIYNSNILPQQIASLKAVNKKCMSTHNDVWNHWKYNTEFHLKLTSFANNDYLIQELNRCMTQLKRAYAQAYWDKWDENEVPIDTRSHESLIDALEKKDLKSALEKLRDDLNDFGGISLKINFGD